jgi:AcrR family transcriptional regulator
MNSHVNPKSASIIPPTQKRGRDMQARLVQATLDLLENQTFEEIGVSDITGQAGVAVGTFYRRFTAKDALLPLLYEVYNHRVEKWFAAMLADPVFESLDREVKVRHVVDYIFELFEENRGLVRALHLNSRFDNRIVPENAAPTRQNVYHAMADLVFPGGASPHQRKRAEAMLLMVISSCIEFTFYPQQTPTVLLDLERDDVTRALTTAALAIVADV